MGRRTGATASRAPVNRDRALERAVAVADSEGLEAVTMRRLARELGVENGFRIVVNTGRDGGQEVQHVHMHVIGGPRPWLKG